MTFVQPPSDDPIRLADKSSGHLRPQLYDKVSASKHQVTSETRTMGAHEHRPAKVLPSRLNLKRQLSSIIAIAITSKATLLLSAFFLFSIITLSTISLPNLFFTFFVHLPFLAFLFTLRLLRFFVLMPIWFPLYLLDLSWWWLVASWKSAKFAWWIIDGAMTSPFRVGRWLGTEAVGWRWTHLPVYVIFLLPEVVHAGQVVVESEKVAVEKVEDEDEQWQWQWQWQ